MNSGRIAASSRSAMTKSSAASSLGRNWTTDTLSCCWTSATSTWVMMPNRPSEPMNRSIMSIPGAANSPAVFLVSGMT